MTAPRPTIHPSPDAQAFWDACSDRRLVLPHCESCDEVFFYPRTLCPACGSRNLAWSTATGHGRIHAFTILHHTAVGELRDALPFVTAIIELDEGPRMMSFLVDAGVDPSGIHCDDPVEVTFLESATGQLFPAFRPST